MEELKTTKKLNKIQQLMRDALKNAPPLQTSQKTNTQFIDIVCEKNDTSNSSNTCNSIMDRLLTHNNINPSLAELNCHKSAEQKCSQTHKWSQLKNNMKLELEIKRMEVLKKRQIEDKLENEELIESEEIDENEELLDDCDNKDHKSDSKLNDINEEPIEESEPVCDPNEDNSEEEINSDFKDDSEEELSESDKENDDNESEDELNSFIDDEARDEDEDEEEEEEEVDDCQRIKSVNKPVEDVLSSKLIVSDESPIKGNVRTIEANEKSFSEMTSSQNEYKFDDVMDDSVLNTSVTSVDEVLTRKFATQNIALSPFNTQPKHERHFNNDVLDILTNQLDLKSNEFDSQKLLGLCSGNFSSNVFQMNDREDEEEIALISSHKHISKAFNVDSDGDESDDEVVNESKTVDEDSLNENESTLKSNNESDNEELIATDAEGEVDYVEEEEDIEKLGKGFFDDEAELSGSDVSSDEEDNEEGLVDDLVDDNQDLPSETELKDEIGRIHNKNLLDEDKRQILLMQEMFFEDGDLHSDGKSRERKFRWNFDDNSQFLNDYINIDSDDDSYVGSEDEKSVKTPALRMTVDETDSITNSDLKMSPKYKLKDSFNSDKMKGFQPTKMNCLSSFVVRDERLKSIISKRNTNSNSYSKRPSKKLKSSIKNKTTSIFDILNTA